MAEGAASGAHVVEHSPMHWRPPVQLLARARALGAGLIPGGGVRAGGSRSKFLFPFPSFSLK